MAEAIKVVLYYVLATAPSTSCGRGDLRARQILARSGLALVTTVNGHGQTLKSGLATIFAISLMAGSSVGVAAQDGAMVDGIASFENCGTTELGKRMVREDCTDVVIEASDERLSGTTDLITYGVTDGDGEGYIEATFGTDVFRLVNEEGAWSGQGTSMFLFDGTGEPTAERTWVLAGGDGYEGLSAYLRVTFSMDPEQREFEGVIIEGELAQPPAE